MKIFFDFLKLLFWALFAFVVVIGFGIFAVIQHFYFPIFGRKDKIVDESDEWWFFR